MIIDCIADLHGHYPKLEGGDLLIIAGDLTASDQYLQYETFFDWLEKQNYKKKVLIGGNHDNHLEMIIEEQICPDEVIYLCDSGIEMVTKCNRLKIWGSPWTKTFPNMNPRCKAFTVDKEKELAEKWSNIPKDVDILITHSPPYGLFDEVKDYESGKIINVGSTSLEQRIFFMTSLKLHVFGHIHEGGGKIKERTHNASDKHISINASYVNERYKPVNKPVRIIL